MKKTTYSSDRFIPINRSNLGACFVESAYIYSKTLLNKEWR